MPTATLLIGISGSGKSTHAAQMVKDNPNTVHLERDKIRAFLQCLPVVNHVLWENDDKPSMEELVTDIMYEQFCQAYRQNKDIIVADTNLYPKHVQRLEEDLTELGFQVRKIVIRVALEEAIRRNELRTEGKVPGTQIPVVVPAPDGGVRVIWGNGKSFPDNANGAVAPVGEMSWTTPGTYTWTVPDGVTAGSALVVDGSGGDVRFGDLAVVNNVFEATQRQLPATAYWRSITYGNGVFVAVSTSGIAVTSPDGITWTQRQLPTTAGWISVTYGNGVFVAVAYGNSIAVTLTVGPTATHADATLTSSNGFSLINPRNPGAFGVSNGVNGIAAYDNDIPTVPTEVIEKQYAQFTKAYHQ
jgi:predicted kinase